MVSPTMTLHLDEPSVIATVNLTALPEELVEALAFYGAIAATREHAPGDYLATFDPQTGVFCVQPCLN